MRKPYGITQEQFDAMTEDQLRKLAIARKQDAVRRESNPYDKLMRRNRSG